MAAIDFPGTPAVDQEHTHAGVTYKFDGEAWIALGGYDLADLGLSNIDDTSDADKPVSTAQQTALDLKLDIIDVLTGIIANAGGGQGSATALTSYHNVIGVCATALDSVKLPAAGVGAKRIIVNNGATSCNIFPNPGDTLGKGTNIPSSLTPGFTVTYFMHALNSWVAIDTGGKNDGIDLGNSATEFSTADMQFDGGASV
jgi:hypothetical protein